jgi:hypothetical protein
VVARATAVLRELRQVVCRQQREIARLREKSGWAKQVRKLLRSRSRRA